MMGTDIHMKIEVEIPQYIWDPIKDDERTYPWQAINMVWTDNFWWQVANGDLNDATAARYAYTMSPYNSRNYTLFGVLGDVRNGEGFAGVDTGDWVQPCVGANRGLPDDVAPYQSFDYGDHSEGWATLEELLDYPWDTTTVTKRGVITLEQYLEGSWRDGGPSTWSGWVTGKNITVLTEEEYFLASNKGKLTEGIDYHIKVQWETSLVDSCKDFLIVLSKIDQLIPLPNDRIRLVYGFDS
jgi:hypothetical protein